MVFIRERESDGRVDGPVLMQKAEDFAKKLGHTTYFKKFFLLKIFFYFSVYRISRLLELKEDWTGATTISEVDCIQNEVS